MYQPRIPIKFSKADDSEEVDFPLAEYSFEWEQPLLAPSAPQSGAHGEFDLLSDGLAPKGAGTLRLSFTVFEDDPQTVETTADDLLAKLFRYGRGKLWTSGLDSNGAVALRWTYARATQMPAVSWEGGQVLSKPMALNFRADPFWYGDTAISPADYDADVGSFTVTNPGNAPIYNAVLTLTGTYSAPVITNTTNGYRLQSSQAGTNDLKFDAGAPSVEVKSGGVFVNDYSHYVRKAGQVHLMVLEPGNNDFTVMGVSAGTLTIAAYPAYH